ncbi:MAG TPA: mannitol dehydrogenase family protein, partial [Roseiarcus sp.]|nr:mannitol dehydrogenase family protein [Roseiarcus sp.]
IGAGVRPADEGMRQKLMAQDWLTTVVEQEAGATDVRVTGVMIDFIKPFDIKAMLNMLARPEIRIVSLTVTEGGYYISPATQRFDPEHPDIVYDARNPEAPRTAFGLIAAGLKRRRAGAQPFTVMSCDNIPGNGHVTENAVAGLAELYDPELGRWIRDRVAFPNSMVDRITPATTDRERAILRDSYGLEDNWPVFCEEFRQWVVEDEFPSGRPALETVGVTFTSDVAPYEFMKIRILNGGHAAIAYPAGLLDIHFVHEAMEDAQIASFLETLTKREIVPVVPPPPQVDLEAYRKKVAERFANPKIGDTISRLCLDGSNRQPKFILPTATDRLKAGASVKGLALVSALWCRYVYGESESCKVIPPNDPNWERLQAAAKPARRDPKAFLAMRDIFGELADNPTYVAAFSGALTSLWSRGVRATLADYLESN